MVRDYAKRPKRKPRRKTRITIIVAIIAIAVPASIYYVKYQNIIHRKDATIKKKLAIQPISTSRLKMTEQPTIRKQAEFDFYTILPKTQVQVPNSTNTELDITAQSANSRYILQVASLQSLKQAQQLKDKLFSLGYIANITSFESKGGIIWNRVMTGPYKSLEDAEDTQDRLRQQHIDGILIKLD